MPTGRRLIHRLHAQSATALAVALSVALVACNDYPVHSLLETFEVRVTDQLSGDKPVKLDFLWVIDHSPSMCQEQRDLAAGFKAFTDTLQSLGAIDARMAVVSVQQTPDKIDVKVIGRFMHRAATVFPPSCFERVLMPCQDDGDCIKKQDAFDYPVKTDTSLCVDKSGWENPYKGGAWTCKAPETTKLMSNLNCSVNSQCVAKCVSDKDCRGVLEAGVPAAQQRSICKNVAGQQGCMFPPDTGDCPPSDQLPDVLQNNQLDLFRCNATLGAASTIESRFEGGFRSAWLALDPKGPNCDYDACVASLRTCCKESEAAWCKSDFNQAKCDKDKAAWCEPLKDKKNCQSSKLLRDDAYLVVVFISDDDDCSVRLDVNPLDKSKLLKEVWDSCQTYGDNKGGNLALSAGHCEYRRSKNADIYCDSDCVIGSTSKKKNGALKCPDGCKSDSAEQSACQNQADIDTAKYKKISSQFAPVGEFVNRFKSLKDDPSRVIVASIVGDTLSTGQVAARDRVNFYRSLFKDQAPGQVPYICQGSRGEASYGSRYVELATAFRENGVVQNICKGSDFGPALKNIATTILQRVIKVCLPQPPYTDESGVPKIKVVRKRGDETTEMQYVEGPQPDNEKSFYIAPSPDCRAGKTGIAGESTACKATRDCAAGLTCIENFCQVYNGAIFFSAVPDPQDKIEINYAADLGL